LSISFSGDDDIFSTRKVRKKNDNWQTKTAKKAKLYQRFNRETKTSGTPSENRQNKKNRRKTGILA